MIVLNLQNISKSYTEKKLLDNISLVINDTDKIGIIGVNGTGKTTLLKIIAGEVPADGGIITTQSGVRIGYLPQNPIFTPGETVLSQALKGFGAKSEVKEFECKSILTRLGMNDFDTKVDILSGGQKKRVAMASILATPCDLLILDEPTNHIDDQMVEWLESYLARMNSALLMVTHDRYFLDRVANKIVELDGGQLYSYNSGYTGYLELKAQREEMEIASDRKRKSILRRELQWIMQGPKARGTKSRSRIENFNRLSEQSSPTSQGKVEMSQISSRLGKKIIEVDNVTKTYDGKELLGGFSYNLLRDDRIGIIGANGCGKSTLLQVIAQVTPPDSGEVNIGSTVNIGYFRQEPSKADGKLKLIDYMKDIKAEVTTNEGKFSASMMLERFLFTPDMQHSTINRLSGGELRRLYLLSILMSTPNVLILDEPTNDLDIHTLSVLEDYLEEFDGAVIVVSHDRYFLDRVANKIFAFDVDGKINGYNGGYSDYLEAYKSQATPEVTEAEQKATQQRQRTAKLKFTYKEQKEFELIDEVIEELEASIAKTESEIALQSSDFIKLQELMEHKEALNQQLSHQMERWVYLNDLSSQIEAEKNS